MEITKSDWKKAQLGGTLQGLGAHEKYSGARAARSKLRRALAGGSAEHFFRVAIWVPAFCSSLFTFTSYDRILLGVCSNILPYFFCVN